MAIRRPNYWRAFWVSAVMIGALDLVFFLYYLSLPISPLRASVVGRDLPNDWLVTAILITNWPGQLAVQAFLPRLDSTTPVEIGLSLAASTIFWAVIAVLIEWLRNRNHPVNHLAPNPDGTPGSS